MTRYSHPLWPNKEVPASCAQSILLSAVTGATIAVLCILVALTREGTGVFPNISNSSLCLAGAAFGLLAFLVYKRSRIAAVLLFLACLGGGIVAQIPTVFGCIAALATFGAMRATFILRRQALRATDHDLK